MKRIALIDGDILRWRYGSKAQKEDTDTGDFIVDPEHEVIAAVASGIKTILINSGATDYLIYLSGKDNFRYNVDPNYKANRKNSVRPYHYDNITNYLVNVLEAVVVNGFEADDAMAAAQMAFKEESIICTNDKDLDQIPGHHYNFVTHNLYYVTEEEAWLNFYTQMLTGDSTDNVKGVPGIGPVKAANLLAGCQNTEEMYRVVMQAYADHFGVEKGEEEYARNYKLLYLVRELFDWDIPW